MICMAVPMRANDGAAAVAAGGIVMSREPRVTMAKEILQISQARVTVDYDFRNDSDEDVTTVVAFPIPDYDHDLAREGRGPSERGFDDFKLWINGAATTYSVEAKAFLKGVEYTDLLAGMDVDIASFGHSPVGGCGPDVKKLKPFQRTELAKVGLVDLDDCEPLWQVKKKYYWQQTFPAHKTIHIRHAYSPILGSSNSIIYAMGRNADPYAVKEINSFCVEGPLRAMLQSVADRNDRSASYVYVDYILTTANTWKMPIEDFTLIVERSHWRNSAAGYVSFCWDGAVSKIDADHFSARAINLVPSKELRIGFFGVRD